MTDSQVRTTVDREQRGDVTDWKGMDAEDRERVFAEYRERGLAPPRALVRACRSSDAGIEYAVKRGPAVRSGDAHECAMRR